MPKERVAHALGSGVVVSPDGYILTNNHVVEGATDIKVSFANEKEIPAKVIGTDAASDIAVIKVAQTDLPTLPLGDSAASRVGDIVLAIGNPFGLGQTVTMGIVSAKGRSGLGIERVEDFIQTDAAINPGNSGGALINARGELIGINTAIVGGQTGGNVGIGFAIPANMARNIMGQLIKTGKVERGFIGIIPNGITPGQEQAFGLKPGLSGVAISQVDPNSPGAKAGLQVGDVIDRGHGPRNNRAIANRTERSGIDGSRDPWRKHRIHQGDRWPQRPESRRRRRWRRQRSPRRAGGQHQPRPAAAAQSACAGDRRGGDRC
jgi:serine protease Do